MPRTPETQQAVLAALEFKCDVLWAQLDALHHAYVEPRHVPPGAFVPQDGAEMTSQRADRPTHGRGCRAACGSMHNEAQGGWVLLAPERMFKADAIAAEILKRCTGEATLRGDRRRPGQDLQGAARAHHGGRVRDAGRTRRQEAAGSLMDATPQRAPRPLGLLAELTHRCPLGCPYCSNPLALEAPHRRTRYRHMGARVPRGGGAWRVAGASFGRRTRRAARPAGDHARLRMTRGFTPT